MKCKYCGEESADGSMFCENCGKKLKKTTTATKVWIAVLSLYIIILIVLSIFKTSDGIIISIIGALMLIIAFWQKNIYLENRPFDVAIPDGKTPSSLFTFSGIGHNLLGLFKYRKIDGTFVAYTFVFILFPLFPTGCYRVEDGDVDNYGVFRSIEWKIYGSEKKSIAEILNIYLFYYGMIIGIMGLIWTLID